MFADHLAREDFTLLLTKLLQVLDKSTFTEYVKLDHSIGSQKIRHVVKKYRPEMEPAGSKDEALEDFEKVLLRYQFNQESTPQKSQSEEP